MSNKFKPRTTVEAIVDMRAPPPSRFSASEPSTTTPHDALLVSLCKTSGCFNPVPKPKPDDWLACNEEKGQSLKSFMARPFKSYPHATFNTIILLQIGDYGMPKDLLDIIKRYVETFYAGCKVEFRGPVKIKDIPDAQSYTCPYNGVKQLLARPLLNYAAKYANSDRGLARRKLLTMALTLDDLNPSGTPGDWLYGIAAASDASSVVSLSRYASPSGHPCRGGPEEMLSTLSSDKLVVRRVCKVVTHELGHLFGIKHCINFVCLMNGANHVNELNRQPLLECPVCTKKLACTLRLDVPARYRALADLWKAMGIDEGEEVTRLNEFILPHIAAETGTGGASGSTAPPRGSAAQAESEAA